jgi:hypothetical protein
LFKIPAICEIIEISPLSVAEHHPGFNKRRYFRRPFGEAAGAGRWSVNPPLWEEIPWPPRPRLWTAEVISSFPDRLAMRARLKSFLPIVLIALVVQILAPIGACWATSIAISDPLAAAIICRGNNASSGGQSDQTGHHAHDGCCSVCSVLQTGTPVGASPTPDIAGIVLEPRRVIWIEFGLGRFASRAGSQAQARAPPAVA